MPVLVEHSNQVVENSLIDTQRSYVMQALQNVCAIRVVPQSALCLESVVGQATILSEPTADASDCFTFFDLALTF